MPKEWHPDPLSARAALIANRQQGQLVSGWDVASRPPDEQVIDANRKQPRQPTKRWSAQPEVATTAKALLATHFTQPSVYTPKVW